MHPHRHADKLFFCRSSTAAAASSSVVGQASSIDLRLQTAQERGTTATSRARLHFASIILSLTIYFTRVNPFQLPSLRVIQFAIFSFYYYGWPAFIEFVRRVQSNLDLAQKS